MSEVSLYDLDAEESVLGAMMTSRTAIDAALEAGLRGEHFYRPSHALIFAAIVKIDGRGDKADSITVCDELRKDGTLEDAGGRTNVATIVQTMTTVAGTGHHARIVVEQAAVRRLHRAATDIREIAAGTGTAEEKLDAADQAMRTALEQGHEQELADIGAGMEETIAELTEAYESGKPRTGLKTGFTKLDELTNGLMPGQLLVLAARPGQGKSTLAANIAENVAARGTRVAIFSLEMGASEIGLRMMASLGKVPFDKLRSAKLTEAEHAQMLEAHEKLKRLPLVISDQGNVTMAAIRAKCRRLQRMKGLGLVVVDYLQLMVGGGNTENRQNEVADISRSMKLLARELGVPVIAVSQLSRKTEARENKRPQLADLRDSGAIEQDADIVAFIYREDYYNPNAESKGETEVIVAKQRSGETGTVKLSFIGKRCKFSNLGRAPFESASEVF